MSFMKLTAFGNLIHKCNRLKLRHPLCFRSRQLSGFSFAGPRKLEEIMKTELIDGKNKTEISDIWMTYHENKERVHGGIVSGEEGKLILERADKT